MLFWIMNLLSLQKIKDQIINLNSDFQNRMAEYLESVHVGKFIIGIMDEIKEQVHNNMKVK